MRFVEKLDPFFEHWGETATIAGVDVEVLFDENFAPILEVESQTISGTARSADLPAIAHGASFVRFPNTPQAKTYSIVGIQPDGSGMTTLVLQEA